jgi:hypothetical protein
MRISSLTRLKQVFRFIETRQESMCREVQLHGSYTILCESSDAL